MGANKADGNDLERGVSMVADAGLSTGHADNWIMLLDEVLWQVAELRKHLDELKRKD